jgi:hypothetical protein
LLNLDKIGPALWSARRLLCQLRWDKLEQDPNICCKRLTRTAAPGRFENRVLHVLATIATATPAAKVRVIVRANGSGKIGAGNYFLSEGNEARYPSLR